MPELFPSFLGSPVIRRAADKGAVNIRLIDIRDYAGGSFRHIDDSPFGGGPGMVMRAEPVLKAIQAAGPGFAAAMTPSGVPYTQAMAREFAGMDHLILVCGHYEGLDERIYTAVDRRVSVGDYVLTGGELPAQVVADSVIRLLPDVLGEGSTDEESFESGLLEYPQYTQPAKLVVPAELSVPAKLVVPAKPDVPDTTRVLEVPEVLRSGNHAAIAAWRREKALEVTAKFRPDLIKEYYEQHHQ